VSETLRTLQDLFLVFTSVLFIVDPLPQSRRSRDDGPGSTRSAPSDGQAGAWTCAITLMSFALGGSLIFRLFGITIAASKVAACADRPQRAGYVQARRSSSGRRQSRRPGDREGRRWHHALGVPMLAARGDLDGHGPAGASKSVVTTIGV